MAPTRLLLIDDHSLFRDSLARLLESQDEFDVVAGCANREEALETLATTPVDVILLDFDLGRDNGNLFVASARQRGFNGKVLFVTAGMSETDARTAIQLGAAGIFLKHDPPSMLTQAIRAVAAGGSWLDPALLRSLALMPPGQREAPAFDRPLTDRENLVLRDVCEGCTNKEIAQRIGTSETAIKATLQQLFAKCGVRTRSQLVRVALERSFPLR
jgi:two-component system, NarL family, nitrate/nitrite response regulator NarL